MKKINFTLRSLLLAMFGILLAYANSVLAIEKSLDKVAVIVNDDIITQSELAENINNARKQLAEMHSPMPDSETLKNQILNGLIDRKLQMQIAKNANITATDDEVNIVIQNIASNNHLSLPKFKEELAKHGMSLAAYKSKIHDEIILRKLEREALSKKIVLNNQDVDSAFKAASKKLSQQKALPTPDREYRVIDFLAPLPENATPAQIQSAKNQVKLLLVQITKTNNFEQFFKDNHGLDLGWRKIQDLPDLFAKIVSKLKVKEVAGPIPAPNGFHAIILFDEKGGGPELPKEITKDQAKSFAYDQKMSEELKKWLAELRSRAYIKIMNE